jgi:hypothetical protein
MLNVSLRILIGLAFVGIAANVGAQSPAQNKELPSDVKVVVLKARTTPGHDASVKPAALTAKHLQEKPRSVPKRHIESLLRDGNGKLPTLSATSVKTHPRLSVAKPDAGEWGWLIFSRPIYTNPRANFADVSNEAIIYCFEPKAPGRYLIDFDVQSIASPREIMVCGTNLSAEKFSIETHRQHVFVVFDVPDTRRQEIFIQGTGVKSWRFHGLEVSVLESPE